ncbi:glycosyltransferase family 4 protein [Novosphingobium sp. 1949]|uniref:Glycosyltransferase family 4 protein n=1 Tax=Novosphingobium organovorum TaxID=2930092 RepID=A0ABT0BGM0_9SPHN|nr:glycosyltransferase family 4 protein [Novosphingobium organovorum]MCJ2184179.1 glycosyltransferase family 4 protein [Novosphingobium organovorum]
MRPIYDAAQRLGFRRPFSRRRRAFDRRAPLPPRALVIWNERPDLQAAFDLSRSRGRESLASWYLRHGFSGLGLAFEASDAAFARLAVRPMEPRRAQAFTPVSWLMRLLHDHLPAHAPRDLSTRAGQHALVSWYYARGLCAFLLDGFLTPAEARQLCAPADPAKPDGPARLLECLWDAEPALATRFAGSDDPRFQAWCQGEGAREFPILAHPLVAIAPPPARRGLHTRPFGVNLFGHAHARSGVSEDVRMAIRVLETAGIPYVLRNVAPGANMPEEDAQQPGAATGLPYAINLFCIPAQTMAEAITPIGRHVIADHYNIGFWPWELPEVPAFWQHAYGFVDEVWASSQFTYAAFCRSAPVPVRHMPFAVEVEPGEGLSRADFGLPEETLLFGFAFDGLSGFARKAPLLALRAFQQAFPADARHDARQPAPVGLVIKGMRAGDSPAWKQLLREIDGDPRVHLVTDSLPRRALLDLWRALDVFVSLHRSEGFGRILAEMMLLGKPVVTSAHSGNMDFTRHDTAALVPCTLRPVAPGEYPFGAGQLWAEADVAAAAERLRTLAVRPDYRDALARQARSAILAQYAVANVAPRWLAALRGIYDAPPQDRKARSDLDPVPRAIADQMHASTVAADGR